MTRRRKTFLMVQSGETARLSDGLIRFNRLVAAQSPDVVERWCNGGYPNMKAFVDAMKNPDPIILKFPS